jgi:hypothetical protein
MKKTLLIILSLSIITFRLFGQDRKQILQYSNDIHIRQVVVDSIVNESFWSTDADYIKWYRDLYKKEDFSEYAKKTLQSYFNRELSNAEKDKIKNECKKRIDRDIERHKLDAIKKEIPFENYHLKILNEETEKDIQIVSERAKYRISPIYARLLGWLNYTPSIPIIESVLKDSLILDDYAKYNKEELALNCKLALARMENKKYEEEILNEYKIMEFDCSHVNFCEPFNNLFYINTRNSINHVIEFSKNNKTYPRYYPQLTLPPCFTKPAILLYLSVVILDYPLNYMFDKKIDFYQFRNVVSWSEEEFYSEQIPKLEEWIKNNEQTYEIDHEKLFLP